MQATHVQEGPLRIDWGKEGTVDVLGKDKHRFLLTMQQAADACARGKEQLVWKNEFDQIATRVHKWSASRTASISATYATFLEGRITFFVVPTAENMDLTLSDAIADLEIELHQDFANCRCEIRQIPGLTLESLETFLNPAASLVIYGEPPTASGSVGA